MRLTLPVLQVASCGISGLLHTSDVTEALSDRSEIALIPPISGG